MLYEAKRGNRLALPLELLRLYGRLSMPRTHSQPYVICNFVTMTGVKKLIQSE